MNKGKLGICLSLDVCEQQAKSDYHYFQMLSCRILIFFFLFLKKKFEHYKQQILVMFVSIMSPLQFREETVVTILVSSSV